MDIRYLLEAVKDCTGDIGDSFSDHPKDDWQATGLIERLEGSELSRDRLLRPYGAHDPGSLQAVL